MLTSVPGVTKLITERTVDGRERCKRVENFGRGRTDSRAAKSSSSRAGGATDAVRVRFNVSGPVPFNSRETPSATKAENEKEAGIERTGQS